jgi:hypothetical protein
VQTKEPQVVVLELQRKEWMVVMAPHLQVVVKAGEVAAQKMLGTTK